MHHLREAKNTATNEDGSAANNTAQSTGRLERGRAGAASTDKRRQPLPTDNARLLPTLEHRSPDSGHEGEHNQQGNFQAHPLQPRTTTSYPHGPRQGVNRKRSDTPVQTMEHPKNRDNRRAATVQPCRTLSPLSQHINDSPPRLIRIGLGSLRRRSGVHVPCVLLRGIRTQPVLHAVRSRGSQTSRHPVRRWTANGVNTAPSTFRNSQ